MKLEANQKVVTSFTLVPHAIGILKVWRFHSELAKQSNPPMPFQALLDATAPIAHGMQIILQRPRTIELCVLEQLVLFKKKALVETLIRKCLDAQIES